MPEPWNLVICGQSGQGIILVTKILTTALAEAGRPVECTEYPAITHRFAITFSHIRSGPGVHSPRIRPGEADVIIGLEPFECLRVSLLYAHPETLILTNDEFIRVDGTVNPLLREPIPTKTIADVVAALKAQGLRRVVPVGASEIALRTLRHRSGTNIVMLGAAFASGRIPLSEEALVAAIAGVVPRGTAERNLEAFRAGMAAFKAATPAA